MIEKYNCSFVETQINEGGQLIDVRPPVEFNQGALDGAINMPIESFQYLKDAIDNTKPVLLYCRTGARSEMVKRSKHSAYYSLSPIDELHLAPMHPHLTFLV